MNDAEANTNSRGVDSGATAAAVAASTVANSENIADDQFGGDAVEAGTARAADTGSNPVGQSNASNRYVCRESVRLCGNWDTDSTGH